MVEADRSFVYIALSSAGAKVRGRLEAASEAAAYAHLKRDGLAPLTLKASRASRDPTGPSERIAIGDRRAAELYTSIGQLLTAGADIRSALTMLADRAGSRPATELCRALLEEVSGGAGIDAVLARRLPLRQGFAGALVAAAQASGDLGSGFTRAGAVLAARTRLRDQLVSTLSYPLFVLMSSVAAVLVILLFVVPTLAPLVQSSGSVAVPPTLQALLWASRALSANLVGLASTAGVTLIMTAILWRLGLLAEPLDRALLDGPFKRVRRGLIYGAFATVLGDMLAAGAPLGDALRLAVRTSSSSQAQVRLEVAAAQVRQGQLLSAGLDEVQGFPPAIVRMCAVGERSGALGLMLARAGQLEGASAMRKLEGIGRLLGPVLIILLGALVGLLMAALLSGLGQIGQTV